MDIRISLILAFRERPVHLDNLIKSIRETTKHLDKIEIIFAIDDDDIEGQNHVKRLAEEGLPKIISYVTKRTIHFTRYYMNPIARMARGRWIIVINDDSIFATKNWDEIIFNKMNEKADKSGDDFWIGMVDDGMIKSKDNWGFTSFCCWPILSKQSVDELGYIFDERFYIWSVDHYICKVYRDMKRRVDIYDVLIDHNSLHTQKREKNELDTNHTRFCEIENKHHFSFTQQTVDQEIKKIRRIIERINNDKRV